MVNKESQRRKIEGSKKESKRQTRKTERESRGYAKKDKQRRKVESRIQGKQNTGKERLKRVGWQDLKRLKQRNVLLHLENNQQQRKEGRKQRK